MEITTIITHGLLFIALYAEVFLLLAFLESESPAKGRRYSSLPSVAIVVPCFNEEKTVAATLRSLLALDYPKNKLSIIAVDDGSADGTAQVLSQFAKDPRITVLSKQNGGKHSAMNLALTKTDAEYIGCLDADSFVAPNALKTSMRCLMQSEAVAVTPAILVHKPKRFIEFIQQAECTLSVFGRRAYARLSQLPTVPELAVIATPAATVPRIIERSEERRVGKECRSRWSPDH